MAPYKLSYYCCYYRLAFLQVFSALLFLHSSCHVCLCLVKLKVNADLYSARSLDICIVSVRTSLLRHSGVDHTVLPANTPHLPLPLSSPEGATTEWTVVAPADDAYYSLIDPLRMKGWVGLVGWHTADPGLRFSVLHSYISCWCISFSYSVFSIFRLIDKIFTVCSKKTLVYCTRSETKS